MDIIDSSCGPVGKVCQRRTSDCKPGSCFVHVIHVRDGFLISYILYFASLIPVWSEFIMFIVPCAKNFYSTLTYLFTSLRTSVLLEELPIVKILKNFPAFYGTWRFVAVFTRALHYSLSLARSIQSVPSHHISLRPTLILSTHLLFGLLFHTTFNICHKLMCLGWWNGLDVKHAKGGLNSLC
jgi:hypothetical protein